MSHEDIKIIIRKNGEIWVDLGGLEPQRVKHYKDLFEEAIGPIKGELSGSDGAGGSGGVQITDQAESEDQDKKREKLKNGG